MIFDRIFGKRSLENPAVPLNSAGIESILGTGNQADSGVNVSPEKSLGYPAVWRAVNIRSGTLGRTPLNVLRRESTGKERDESHPAFKLLRDSPNRDQSAKEFIQLLESHCILLGGGYAFIERNSFGQPTALIPLDPMQVLPYRENGRLGYSIMQNGKMVVELPENILHIHGLSWDGINGLGVCDILRDSIGLGLAAQKYQSIFFKNGAAPMTVIELPNALRNKEAIERFRSMWGRRHQGIENAHQPALLENGAQLKSFSVSPSDAQMLATRDFEIRQIANIVGLPSHLLGDNSKSSFASLEIMQRILLFDLMDPMTNWETEVGRKLLSEQEREDRTHVIEFDKESIERPDLNTFTNALSIQVNNGLLTLDEARNKMNMPPLPNGMGSQFRIPLNMGVIGAAPTEPADIIEDEEGQPAPEVEPKATTPDLTEAAASVLQHELERAAERIAVDAKKRAKTRDGFDAWLGTIDDRHRKVITHNTRPAAFMAAKATGQKPGEVHVNTLHGFFATIRDSYKLAAPFNDQERALKVNDASTQILKDCYKLARQRWSDDSANMKSD
jgi:HK97 family phage portal protein